MSKPDTTMTPLIENPAWRIGLATELLGIVFSTTGFSPYLAGVFIGFGAGLIFWPSISSIFGRRHDN